MHSAFKDNFKNKIEEEVYMCSLCGKHRDNQNEIESCEEMKQNISHLHKVEEIYGDGVTEETAAVMEKVLKLKAPK